MNVTIVVFMMQEEAVEVAVVAAIKIIIAVVVTSVVEVISTRVMEIAVVMVKMLVERQWVVTHRPHQWVVVMGLLVALSVVMVHKELQITVARTMDELTLEQETTMVIAEVGCLASKTESFKNYKFCFVKILIILYKIIILIFIYFICRLVFHSLSF